MNDKNLKFQNGASRYFLVVLIGASAFSTVSCGEKPVGDSAATPIVKAPAIEKEPSPEEKFSLLLGRVRKVNGAIS